MRVFLTGASGYIGSAGAAALRAKGHDLTGLARTDASAARLAAAGIRPVRGTVRFVASAGGSMGRVRSRTSSGART